MMLLSSLIFALVSPTLAAALPTPSPAYAFDPTTALSSRHGGDIARLAAAVNDAHCPDRANSNIVARSRSQAAEDEGTDVGWIISHDRSRHTYALAFSSPSPEDTLELLASGTPSDLTTLPPTFFSSGGDEGAVSIYTPYAPLLPIADQAVEALRSTIEDDRPSLLSRLLSLLLLSRKSDSRSVRVEVVGHGLGSVTALLASLRLSSQDPSLSIETTLFSLPRVGNQRFAKTVDSLLSDSDSLSIRRVSSGRDPIPDLPPPHFGLHQPSSIQHLSLGADAGPGRSRVEDSQGPYAGVMIGLESEC